jgi:hypothetical protein
LYKQDLLLLKTLVDKYGDCAHKSALEEICTALEEAQKTPDNSAMDAILALKAVTPMCPDLCKEWNSAIDAVVSVLKQHHCA